MFVSTEKISTRDFSEHPLLWISVCFAVGIFLSGQFLLGWKLGIAVAIMSAGFSAICRTRILAASILLIGFVGAGVFYSETRKDSVSIHAIKNLFEIGQLTSGDAVEVEGLVVGAPESAVGGFYLTLAAQEITSRGTKRPAVGNLRFFAAVNGDRRQKEYDDLGLIHGGRFRIGCRIEREEHYRNPGSVSRLNVLDQNQLDATATIKSPLLIEPVDRQNVSVFISSIYYYRSILISEINSTFDPSTAGILVASTLGNRNFLTKETGEIFRSGGTYHILIISGLHITFIGGVIFLIIGRITKNRLARFVLTSTTLWIYSFAVGAETPVLRAATMFTIWIFSVAIYRRTSSQNTLGACLLLLLLLEPSSLYSLSFQLTFTSMAGIVTIAFPLLEKLRSIGSWSPKSAAPFPPQGIRAVRIVCETIYWSERKWIKTLGENVWDCRIFKNGAAGRLERIGLQRPIRWMFEGIIVSLSVQLVLLPFLIQDFHRFSYASVILNLWVGPLAVLQNIFAIISLCFLKVSDLLAVPMIRVTELTNVLLLSLPGYAVEQGIASLRVPVYSGRLSLLYSIYFVPILIFQSLLCSWNPFQSKALPKSKVSRKWSLNGQPAFVVATLLFGIIFILVVFHPFSAPSANGKLTVDFLDVGQGDSCLITFPNGETMLVDGGGKPDYGENTVNNDGRSPKSFKPDRAKVGESVVSEFLWEKGYSKIDYIVATHADADHVRGLIDVAKNFRVRFAMISYSSNTGETFAEFLRVAEKKKIARLKIERGDSFNIGAVIIDVLHPRGSTSNDSTNNGSIVIKTTYGSRGFLFTGDIETRAETVLTENSGALASEVVKVPHHGSRTSSTTGFVKAVGAKYAIISVGRSSQFGHPHKEVVERWRNMGAKVLTTGERGTITISTDGKKLEVQTYADPNSAQNQNQ